jgi:type IV secretory pathway TrbD component
MQNIGSTDRALRLIVGIILAVLGLGPKVGLPVFVGFGGWGWLVGIVGLVMIVTAVIRFCPAYTLIGINTCKK